MSRDGNGNYSLPAGNPVVTGTTISTTWANNSLSDIASALTASIAKDGQTTPTANLPMGGYVLTGLGDGTANGHSLRYEQVIDAAGGNTVPYLADGTGAVETTVQAKLREVVSVKDFGAVGDGVADDTAAIQAALTALSGTRKYVFLPSGTYLVSSRLTVPTKTGLISDRSATIYAASSGFTATNPLTRYTSTETVIDMSGQTVSPYTPSEDQVCSGIRIQYQFVEGRVAQGIVARNCINVSICDNELFDFPLAYGIRVATLSGQSRINGNYIHDFSNNTNFGGSVTSAHVNITGIDLDDDRVNSVSSVGVVICDNRIENLGHGATAIAAYGDQADGIGIQNGTGHIVCRNTISDINEGIDTYADLCTISNNVLLDIGAWGIKLIHGASYNTVSKNIIYNAGLASITVNGGNLTNGDCEFNLIEGNICYDVDPTGANDASNATSCIKITNQSTGPVAARNTFRDNVLRPGTYGNYNILIQDTGNVSNVFENNVYDGEGSDGYTSLDEVSNVLRNNMPTLVRVSRSGAQTITTGTDTKIEFNSVSYDRNNEYDETTNFRWTCVRDGIYRIFVKIRMAGVTSIRLKIKKNGSVVSESYGSDDPSDISESTQDTMAMTAGDYIEFWLQHNSGAAKDVTSGGTVSYATIEEV